TISMPISWHALTVFGLKPGDTIKVAPASFAAIACSRFSTVPAPISMSGWVSRSRRIASAAAAERKVISAAGSPFSASTLPSGIMSSALSMAITGMTFRAFNCSLMLDMSVP
ncbi:hypothetical protein D039_0905B, partial [Vibrio parahaemolyticus EKP-028]